MEKINFRPKLLCRNRIYQILDEIFKTPFIFLSAPMGYGKTTAVKNYLDTLGSNINTVWFSILEGEDDETWIWNQLLKIIDNTDYNIGEKLKGIGFPYNRLRINNIIELLRNTIKHELIVVIDDWHNMPQTNSKISWLIESLCKENIPKLHFIIISRKHPEDSYIELENKTRCIILSDNDIKFTKNETKEFFVFNGLELKKNDLEKIYSYTSGWTAATYLALLEYNDLTSFQNEIPKAEELLRSAVYNKFNKEMQKK